jgi:hypothetical protein
MADTRRVVVFLLGPLGIGSKAATGTSEPVLKCLTAVAAVRGASSELRASSWFETRRVPSVLQVRGTDR